jgi:hypothetical protein
MPEMQRLLTDVSVVAVDFHEPFPGSSTSSESTGVVTYTDCSHGLRTQRLKTSPAWPTSNRLRQIERFAFEEIHIVPEELDRKRGRSSQGTYAFSGVLNMLKWDAGSVKACIPIFCEALTHGGLA